MEQKTQVTQFLNSIWLLSSVKEWLMRILFVSFGTLFILFGLDVHKNGLNSNNITNIIFSLASLSLLTLAFIYFLYVKWRKGKLLKNKSELFK